MYTFFHPMLRDEQDIDKTNLLKLKGKLYMTCSRYNPYYNHNSVDTSDDIVMLYHTISC